MSKPKPKTALEALGEELRRSRTARKLTQQQQADDLRISRKTYLLFEAGRWTPAFNVRADLARRLYDADPPLARAFADALGEESLEALAIVLVPAPSPPAPPPSPPPLDAAAAQRAFDDAIYRAADDLNVTAKSLRAIAAALVPRLHDAKLTIEQAAAHAQRQRDVMGSHTPDGSTVHGVAGHATGPHSAL